jgi:hypothetical protein
MRFELQRTARLVSFDARLQAQAVPHVEVHGPRRVREIDLLAGNLVLIAVHDRPQRPPVAREATGEHTRVQRLLVRRPVRAHHQRRELPLDRRDPP